MTAWPGKRAQNRLREALHAAIRWNESLIEAHSGQGHKTFIKIWRTDIKAWRKLLTAKNLYPPDTVIDPARLVDYTRRNEKS